MQEGKVRFRQKCIGKIGLSAIVYVLIGGGIYKCINRDFAYLAQKEFVQRSMNEYYRGILWSFAVALVLNVLWWWLATNKRFIRQSFEKYSILYVIILGGVLFASIAAITNVYRGIIDDLGTEHVLRYGYCIGGGFLINIFLFPPQTIKDVILPGGRWLRVIISLIIAVVIISILA